MTKGKAIEIGKVYKNNTDVEFRVLSHEGKRGIANVYMIEFLVTGFKRISTASHINNGQIKDYYYPVVGGVGYIGMEKVPREVGRKPYDLWYNMISRCYNEAHPEFNRYGEKGVTVDKKWHSFKNFLEDLSKIEGYDRELFYNGEISIDKDKKQTNIKNKIYSLETCCFLLNKENYSMTNSSDRRRKFIAYSPDGVEYFVDNMREFSEQHDLSYKGISKCLNGDIKTHKKWRFKPIDDK